MPDGMGELMSGEPHARFELLEAGIARITLNRPERLGAYTPRMCSELLDALRSVRLDDSIRVLVLTGTGRGFCSGGDVSEDAGFGDHTAHQMAVPVSCGRIRTRSSPPCTSSTSRSSAL